MNDNIIDVLMGSSYCGNTLFDVAVGTYCGDTPFDVVAGTYHGNGIFDDLFFNDMFGENINKQSYLEEPMKWAGEAIYGVGRSAWHIIKPLVKGPEVSNGQTKITAYISPASAVIGATALGIGILDVSKGNKKRGLASIITGIASCSVSVFLSR